MKLYTTKFISLLIIVIAIVLGYSVWSVWGGTIMNVLIATNPDLESGLVGHWTFDGGLNTKIEDRSGNGNHGYLSSTMATSSAVAPGVIGQALEFDGSDDYVDTNNYINVFDDDFSISFWMKQTGSSYMVPVSKGYDNGGWGPYVRFVSDTANSFFYLLTNNPSNSSVYAYGALVNDGGWHHLLGVRQGNSAIYYIDGVLQNSSSLVNGGNYNSNYNPLIGAGNYNGTILSHFDGSIDDVRVYNRALSTDEISRLYDLGKTTHINKTITTNPDLESGLIGHWTFDGGLNTKIEDSSGNGNHGYLCKDMATSSAVVPGKTGQALHFDGVNDFVDVSSIAGDIASGDVSMSAWVKFDEKYDSGDSCVVVFRLGDLSSSNDVNFQFGNWYEYFIAGAGAFGVGAYDSSGHCAGSSQTSWLSGRWHHLVGTVVSGGAISAYVDGVLVGTDSMSGSRGASAATNAFIGKSLGAASAFYFPGTIDDVRIYNRVLSVEEIQKLYKLGQ